MTTIKNEPEATEAEDNVEEVKEQTNSQEELLGQILQCLQDIRYEVNYTQRILWLIAIVVTVQFLLFAVFSGVIEVDDFGNWNFWFQEEEDI